MGASIKALAPREGPCNLYTSRLLPLAYLAPAITEATAEGRGDRRMRRAGAPSAGVRLGLNRGFLVGFGGREFTPRQRGNEWSEWQDSNLRPPRPERGALPD